MMRPTFKKLEVKDIGSLERLVAENVEGVEPGLKIVDSRLVLGQAAIDLVGLDGRGSLVLVALDFSADDGLLLRVMDAYSWCLEYPDTLRRLYPMAQASSRPPRILFIVEKMTDAFLRRVKQLSYLEIDCFEFRHLEVNGASVVYFDLIERLRKVVESVSDAQAPGAPAPVAAIEVPAPAVVRHVEPAIEARVEPVKTEPVKPAIQWAPRAETREEPTAPVPVEAPKIVAPEPVRVERPVVAMIEPEPVVPVAVAPVAAAPPVIVVPAAPVVEPASAPALAVESNSVVDVPTPAAPEFQSVKLETTAVVSAAPKPAIETPGEPLQLEAIESTSTRAHTNGYTPAPVVEPTPAVSTPVAAPAVAAPVVVDAPAPVAAPPVVEAPVVPAPVVAAPVIAAPAPVVAAPAPIVAAPPVVAAPAPAVVAPVPSAPAPVQAPPVWAKPTGQPNGGRQFFAQAGKSSTPVEAPAMVAAVAAAEVATQPAATKVGLEVDDRPELESLSFPKDGLSRQWLEFLSQLGATK